MPPGGRLLRVDVILHRAARFEVGPNFHRCFLLTVLFRLSDVSSLHIRFGFHLPWSFRSRQRHALCQSSALALSCSKSIALNGDGRLGTTTVNVPSHSHMLLATIQSDSGVKETDSRAMGRCRERGRYGECRSTKKVVLDSEQNT